MILCWKLIFFQETDLGYVQVTSHRNFEQPFDSKSSKARITQAVEQASNPCAEEGK